MRSFTAAARILVASILLAFASSIEAQQVYPAKPIRFIVPYTPGGATSALVLLFGQKLTESWGQQVLVDNRPGGGTIVGSEALVKSPPDGYSIMLVTTTHALNALLVSKLPYDTVKDFAPVATVARSEYLLVVHPSVPANNLQELIALAKSKPGQLSYATSGSGTVVHLGVELLSHTVGIKMENIPYKGAGQVVVDLIGGQVQLSFIVPINVLSHIRAGKLKAIAISGNARSPMLARVPTFAEAGLPGFEVKNWYGVLAPAGTSRPVIDKLSTEIARILAMPDIKERLLDQGMEPMTSSPAQFVELIKAEIAKYGKVIKTANITIER